MTEGHPNTQLSGDCIRFCWLRETAPGHLEHDGAVRIAKKDLLAALLGIHPVQQRTSPGPSVTPEAALDAISGVTDIDEIPTWARRRLAAILGPLHSAEQRAEAAANVSILMDIAARLTDAIGAANDIEVHLPYVDRRRWADRMEILSGARFVHYQGRIIPHYLLEPGAMAEYYARWIAVASVDPSTSVEILFSHTHTLPSALIRSMLPVDAEVRPPASPRAAVHIRQTMSATACRAWNTAPAETTIGYYDAHSRASMAVQSVVRRWFGWHWFSSLTRFDNLNDAYAVLAYMVSRPFAGRGRTDITYDIMTDDWTLKAFHATRRPLRQALSAIFQALRAKGDTKLALRFQPERSKTIVERARTQPRTLWHMLGSEGVVVNHLLQFGVELRGATDAFTVSNMAAEYAYGLSVRLRRIFREQDLSYLAIAIMMEATNALWKVMEGPSAVSTTVTASPAPDVEPEPIPAPSDQADDPSQAEPSSY
ncbi:MAG: hypothetical protein JSU00_19635 [Acidobacteria bacterium]|nr:hypothetical protein [Acidobacteriota bacterium]